METVGVAMLIAAGYFTIVRFLAGFSLREQ